MSITIIFVLITKYRLSFKKIAIATWPGRPAHRGVVLEGLVILRPYTNVHETKTTETSRP